MFYRAVDGFVDEAWSIHSADSAWRSGWVALAIVPMLSTNLFR